MMTALPAEVGDVVQRQLNITVKDFNTISGGCINNGGRMDTSDGSFFIKWNSVQRFPHMFASEASGLQLLASAKCIRTPTFVHQGEAGELQFIVLEFIDQGMPSARFWEKLGSNLASLHQVTSTSFGLDHENYIGSLPQINKQTPDWIDFFVHQRIEPQLAMLNPSNAIRKKFEQLYNRLPDVFPVEKPALLHGDLWNGNLIRDGLGAPCLIDPAVYFGHREMDLAFTQLFGGFDQRFYETYQAVFPLQPGYQERVNLCNLYPLLVHANLFGGHYMREIDEILGRWA